MGPQQGGFKADRTEYTIHLPQGRAALLVFQKLNSLSHQDMLLATTWSSNRQGYNSAAKNALEIRIAFWNHTTRNSKPKRWSPQLRAVAFDLEEPPGRLVCLPWWQSWLLTSSNGMVVAFSLPPPLNLRSLLWVLRCHFLFPCALSHSPDPRQGLGPRMLGQTSVLKIHEDKRLSSWTKVCQ